ncbi:zf-HC2 domain-containing protein [candidate division KSB1 bacterium]|nr:zf-HC2 domain-containing protein [candidate division KSB1 bacterium]
MKDFNQSKIANCEHTEELLVRQIFEDLTENETQDLNDHLKICEHCQSYRLQLTSFQQSMNIENSRLLKPDPAIRKRIIQQIKSLQPAKASFIQIIWQKLLGIMQYRIPVYQGVIGMAVSLFILFAVNNFSFAPKRVLKVAPEFHARNEAIVPQLNVVNSLEIIEQQKIGRSVSEDTLLTRFVVTTM